MWSISGLDQLAPLSPTKVNAMIRQRPSCSRNVKASTPICCRIWPRRPERVSHVDQT
jgi:hypothetical protein